MSERSTELTPKVARPGRTVLPQDLSLQMVKLARRIQALPDNAVYDIIVVKRKGELVWSVREQGGLEMAKDIGSDK